MNEREKRLLNIDAPRREKRLASAVWVAGGWKVRYNNIRYNFDYCCCCCLELRYFFLTNILHIVIIIIC